MTDETPKPPFDAGAQDGPKGGVLAYHGEGKTIAVDAAVLSGSETDTLFDFLALARLQGYRVVVQSPTPAKSEALLDRRAEQKPRLRALLDQVTTNDVIRKVQTPVAVLMQGGPAVNRGQPVYLRITMDRNFKVNEWGPLDSRMSLNILTWKQGPAPTQERLEAAQAFRKKALGRVVDAHRKEMTVARSALALAMAEAGWDFVQFQKNVAEGKRDPMQGVRPAAPKGPDTPKQ